MSNISIIFKTNKKLIDVIELVLLYKFSDTLLPEIYGVIGKDKFIEFLSVFSGTTVKVPSFEELKNAIRDAIIYAEVKKGSSTKYLAKEYGITEKEVEEIYADVSTYLSNLVEIKS